MKNDGQGTPQDKSIVCQVGVESTVAKVKMNSGDSDSEIIGSITILRHGAVSSESIREAMEKDELSK